jgi:hypothetical protein
MNNTHLKHCNFTTFVVHFSENFRDNLMSMVIWFWHIFHNFFDRCCMSQWFSNKMTAKHVFSSETMAEVMKQGLTFHKIIFFVKKIDERFKEFIFKKIIFFIKNYIIKMTAKITGVYCMYVKYLILGCKASNP